MNTTDSRPTNSAPVVWSTSLMFALTLLGALVGDIWGVLLLSGLLRLVVNHHVTFFINSLAHTGARNRTRMRTPPGTIRGSRS